jgi:IS30 family transposase
MPTERTKRTARKLDRAMALEQAKRGMSTVEIAKRQGVAPSTVFRFLQRMKPEQRALEHFKTHRADVLAKLQLKSLDAQERIIDTLNDGVIKALTPSQKSSFLISLNVTTGTCFDKERLQRGQSTSNQSIISRMLDDTVKNLYEPKKRCKTESSPAHAARREDIEP